MKNNKSQKGSQNAFIIMLLALIILAFAFLFFVRSFAFEAFKTTAPTEQASEKFLRDGVFVELFIGDVVVKAEVSKSIRKRQEGLSGRTFLERDEGMLFVFDKADRHSFWNKDTLIPLDLLWLKDDKVVFLGALPKIEGDTTLSIRPDQEADMALEVNAGFIELYDIKIGDKVNFRELK